MNKEESYIYRTQSNVYTQFKCPTCGKIYKKAIYVLSKNGFRCENCTDKKSIGERTMREILNAIGEKYIMEYTRKHATWCINYRYDFYLCNYNTIIEIHGRQHYIDSPPYRNLKFQKENDIKKENLAMENGINQYIVIDARESDFEYVYNSIMQSSLFHLLNLEDIDKQSIKDKVLNTSTLVNICSYWVEHPTCTISEIVNIFHLSKTTIRAYLKQGNQLSICNYTPFNKTHKYNPNENDAHEYSHPIYCEELNMYFKSIGLCSKHSKELFGRHIGDSTIREILKNKRKSVRKINYTFKYVSKEEFNNSINNNNICTYGSPFLKIS